MAAIAKQTLAGFDGASVRGVSFEDWQAGAGDFDLVVAANSLQWVEKKTRTVKIAQVLRPAGTLAILRKIPVESKSALEKQIVSALPEILPFQPEPEIWPREREFEKCGWFDDFAKLRYSETLAYSGDEYVALLSTMNRYQRLSDTDRVAAFERIREAVRSYADRIVIHYATHLLLARRNQRDSQKKRSFFAPWFSK